MNAGFELIALWSEKMVENSLEMAELENASPHEADKWIVFPNLSSNLYDLLLIANCILSVFFLSSTWFWLTDAVLHSF